MNFFAEFTLIILVAAVLAFISRFLRQPAIIAYVITGILLGPMFLGLIHESDQLFLFSQIGVSLLLFIVGISLNPKHLKEIGKVSLVTGLGQIVFTSIIGFIISKYLSFGTLESIY